MNESSVVHNHLAGIDYDTPHCDCTPAGQFWDEFTTLFAKATSGNAFFLANGQRPDNNSTYTATSFFGRIEIPNMDPNFVRQVVTIVVHESGKGIVKLILST